MFDQLVALFTDPVWWLVTVCMTLALNILAAFLYDKLKKELLNFRVRRLTVKVISQASFDATVAQLMKNSEFVSSLEHQSRSEIANIVLLVGLGAAQYLAASAEYQWYSQGNYPSIGAAASYFALGLGGLFSVLLAIRWHLQTRSLLATARKLQARVGGSSLES